LTPVYILARHRSTHQQQQQQQQPHHTSPTPTPSDDLTPVSVGADSTTKDASSMDASKSTMWLGTEDGW